MEAHKELEKEEVTEENMVAYMGIMALSEEDNNPDILQAIEELEPDSGSELARRINSVLNWAKSELKGLETKKGRSEKSSEESNNADAQMQEESSSVQVVLSESDILPIILWITINFIYTIPANNGN